MSTITPVIIEIKPSKMLDGEIGLFAVRSIKKTSLIADANKLGEIFFPWSEFERLDRITKLKIKQYCLQTSEGFYAPENFNYLSVPWNMNHSCNYNVGFDDYGNFITIRDIKKGEELCWDYGMGISDPKFKMVCKCNSKNCRQIITGNDWKNVEFLQRNKQYFLRELRTAAISMKQRS